MNLIDKDLPKLKILITSLLIVCGIIILVAIGILFYTFRPILIEDYCMKEAINKTGDKSDILVEPNEEELRNYPNLIKKGDKITLYYREFLKCGSKQKQKLFYLF